jgi:hypothetical protein
MNISLSQRKAWILAVVVVVLLPLTVWYCIDRSGYDIRTIRNYSFFIGGTIVLNLHQLWSKIGHRLSKDFQILTFGVPAFVPLLVCTAAGSTFITSILYLNSQPLISAALFFLQVASIVPAACLAIIAGMALRS